MQELAYSTYCSLKYLLDKNIYLKNRILLLHGRLVGRGRLVVGWWKNRHTRCKKCYARYNGREFMGEFDKYLQEIGIEQGAISAFQSQRTGKTTQEM